jgi:hypothetical protein
MAPAVGKDDANGMDKLVIKTPKVRPGGPAGGGGRPADLGPPPAL